MLFLIVNSLYILLSYSIIDLNNRYRFSGDFLPVTIVIIVVTPHPLETRSLMTGDDIDFDADPSVSGVTA